METAKAKNIHFKLEKMNADTLTPVGIFKRLDGARKFLLESSVQHEKKGKYSYIGVNPYEEIIGHGNGTTVINHEAETKKEIKQNVLQYIKSNFPKLDLDLPLPFTGGAIGYIGYDAIRHFQHIGEKLEDDLEMPDVHLMVYKNIIVYEHSNETAHLIAMNVDQQPEAVLEERIQSLKEVLKKDITVPAPEASSVNFQPNISKDAFMEKVKVAKKYIHDGEAEQIVLSQRMQAELHVDPFSFYRKLRVANPSPYMFYIDFSDYLIIGASPETLIQTTGNNVVTNPIAGTRARGKTKMEDEQLMHDLLQDKKELSEHEMLVTLSKDELLQTCDANSVHAPVYMNIEKYEHVMHIVSEVHGTLKKNFTSIDALIASLPAGTVSGSPKKRAMQIVNELEEKTRGFYGGGIGYMTFNHDLNIALAIRSLVIKENKAYLQAGAGIVKDSIPENEYLETMNKARSLMENGLDT
ncbi:anthranilate synthase component I [Virgibacillus sp. W0181]|uniref:anthranilate synthase component I n=1 Tax=Virgibacillus sp. W0181 TaxID=3391581 RepID=UPI003F44EADE